MRIFTWGIIGLGKIARSFAEAVNALDNTRLICASRNASKARGFAISYNAKKFYGSYEELAKDREVDIVYIATPMSCHYEDVKMCLENGKNVLCEKSVTVNAAQWNELVSLAASKKLFLMEAMWMKCLPSFLKVKQWITDGRIGTPIAVKAEFNSMCAYKEGNRLFEKSLGGGALLDLGVYVLTFACDILGYEPDHIYSAMKCGVSGTDFHDIILLKYKNNCFAGLTASFEISSENYAYIIGTNGFISMGPWFHCSNSAEITENNGAFEKFFGNFLCNGYEYEVMEVQRCISERATDSLLVPTEKTLAVMRIMDEIRRQNDLVYDGQKYEK